MTPWQFWTLHALFFVLVAIHDWMIMGRPTWLRRGWFAAPRIYKTPMRAFLCGMGHFLLFCWSVLWL